MDLFCRYSNRLGNILFKYSIIAILLVLGVLASPFLGGILFLLFIGFLAICTIISLGLFWVEPEFRELIGGIFNFILSFLNGSVEILNYTITIISISLVIFIVTFICLFMTKKENKGKLIFIAIMIVLSVAILAYKMAVIS